MTERPCVACGQTITVTTRNPNRRFCSPRCRVADWHARNDRRVPHTAHAVPRTGNDIPHAVPNDVPNLITGPADDVPNVVPTAISLPDNGIPAANGVQRCPHCHRELAVIAVIIPAEAAHIPTPEVIAHHI
ncbi:hypothetical protein DMH04_47940 [Kibdelosporangium aridum]|uniref:DNA gyrase inhibitor YacG n=1 Tax=Kibdelosporangium aridum TaxID=2030 RepID=A0A428YK38_KIBAR|nr:hypothetical protein [Kibdelosporangium aridum]RSM67909.1 hypothetical protein DMH04_47940 [Kibdelosporangium aridum]